MIKFFHHLYHRRYHGIYQHAQQLFIFDIILLGLAIGMLGTSLWFFFWKPGISNLIELTLSVGTARLKSGDLVHLNINFTNHSKFNLHNASLALHLPPGFIIDRSRTPTTTLSEEATLIIPALAPGASGHSEITGWLWTTPNTEEKIIGVLSYLTQNRSVPEQKFASFIIRLPESIITATLDVATTSFPNQPLPYLFTISNNGTYPVTGISINHNWRGTSLDKAALQNLSLAPQETKQIRGEITFPATHASNFVLETVPQITIQQNTISLTPLKTSVRLIEPRLIFYAQIPPTLHYAEAGEDLPIEIHWENKSAFPFEKAHLRLTFSPAGIVDLSATARAHHLRVIDDELVIDEQNRTLLAAPLPGSTDTFTVLLKTAKTFALHDPHNNILTINPLWEAITSAVPGQPFRQAAESIKLPLATQVTLRTETRYYTNEGDQLGRGPLPPRVGETTKYWIFLQATNGVNPLRDIALTTTLVPGVKFTGKQSVTLGPELRLNSDSQTMSWNFRDIPAASQTGWYFEVAVTPSPEQLGKPLSLTGPVTLKATDAVVGKEFNISSPGLTNVLPADDRGVHAAARVSP